MVVDEIERFIDSPEVTIDFVAPLANFTMELEAVEIGDFTIRRLSDEEASRFFASYGPVDTFHQVYRPEYVLTGRVALNKAL